MAFVDGFVVKVVMAISCWFVTAVVVCWASFSVVVAVVVSCAG